MYISVIQQLITKNDDLEAKITATKSVADLEQRVHDLEQRLI